MFTSLDLMVILLLLTVLTGALALCLLFLARNPKVKQISLYATSAIALYVCSISCRMFGFYFPLQCGIGVALGLLSIAAIVLERCSKDNPKRLRLARVMATISLLAGIANICL